MALTPAQTNTSGNPSSGEVTTLLGRGSEFEGKLSFEGTVRVDGKLSGEIFTDDVLIIGEGAEVNAEINVGAIIIEGTVHGNIHAKRSVEIHTPARVRGNISTPSLSIDKGVVFDGQCQMEQNGAPAGKSRGSSPVVSEATID
jgi:cytoskeletal protein CcmA (bactofilin family)